MSDYPTIRIHAGAPLKPSVGAPCNGCGVCCLAAPCPVSALLLAHKTGPCPALVWNDEHRLYRCGMLQNPAAYSRWIPAMFKRPTIFLVRRWLALDIGCDSSIETD
jgi:hypothetical protein